MYVGVSTIMVVNVVIIIRYARWRDETMNVRCSRHFFSCAVKSLRHLQPAAYASPSFSSPPRAIDYASSHHHHTVTYNTDFSLRNIINGLTIIFFAFGGHAVMVDILSDMKDPRHFPRAVYWSQVR